MLNIFTRSIILYLIAAGVFFKIYDDDKVNIRILNYLKKSAQYVNQHALGEQPFNQHQFRSAIEYYNKVLDVMPQLTTANGVLGYSYYHLNDYDQSLAAFDKVVKENPEFFGYFYNRGFIYFEEKEWEKAIEAFQEALKVDPSKSVIYYDVMLSRVFEDQRAQTLWLKKLSKRIEAGYTDSLKMIIMSHYELEQYDEVYSLCFGQLKLDVDNAPFFHYYAGISAYHLKAHKQAFYHLNEYTVFDNQNPQIFKYLAKTLEKLDNKPVADALNRKAETLIAEQVEFKSVAGEINGLYYYIPLFEI